GIDDLESLLRGPLRDRVDLFFRQRMVAHAGSPRSGMRSCQSLPAASGQLMPFGAERITVHVLPSGLMSNSSNAPLLASPTPTGASWTLSARFFRTVSLGMQVSDCPEAGQGIARAARITPALINRTHTASSLFAGMGCSPTRAVR